MDEIGLICDDGNLIELKKAQPLTSLEESLYEGTLELAEHVDRSGTGGDECKIFHSLTSKLCTTVAKIMKMSLIPYRNALISNFFDIVGPTIKINGNQVERKV